MLQFMLISGICLAAFSLISQNISYQSSYNNHASSHYDDDKITTTTITNWSADHIRYLLQPGMQNSVKKSQIEQFISQHASRIAHNVRYDQYSSRDEVKQQVHDFTRSLVIDFIMKNVQQTVNNVIHKIGVNANWIHNNLINDIIESYSDTVLRLLDNGQRLTELYKDLERNVERIIRAQLGHR